MKTIALLLALAGLARAHHGQDFFVTLDARVPALGGFSVFGTTAAGEQDFELETGFLAGLGAGFAGGVSIDFSDDGSFHASGITPLLQWSAPLGEGPFCLGAALSYHFHDSSRSRSGAPGGGHSHGGHIHRSLAPGGKRGTARVSKAGFNPDAPPDPDPAPGGGAAFLAAPSTIHLHDTDYYLARLILEYELGRSTRLVGNLILAGTTGDDLASGYALAIRHELHPKWAVGLEAIGDFNTHGWHQIVGSVIHNPRHDLGLRLGIGHGLGPAGEGASALAGITWRY